MAWVERADKAGFVFDIQAVVVEALERAVGRVDGELAEAEQGAPAPIKASPVRRPRRPAGATEDLKGAI